MADAGGIDWITWVGCAAAVLGAAFAVHGYYRNEWRAARKELLSSSAEGQVAREDASESLQQKSYGDRYLTVLEGGLDRLQRFYGPARKPYALMLSMAIALAYSWVFFFTFWGFGWVEGDLLGQQVLQPVGDLQLPFGLAIAIMPPGLF